MAMVASLLGIEFLPFFCHGLDSILLSSFPYLIYSRAFGLKIGIIHFHPLGTQTTLRKILLCVSSSYFLEWSPHLHCHRLKVKGKLPFVHWGHVSIHLSEVDTTSSLHLVYERPYQWALIILQTARKNVLQGSVEWQKNNRVNCHVLPPYFFPMQFRQNIRQCHHLSLLFVFNSRRRSAKKKTWKYRFRLSKTYRNSQLFFNDWKLRNWNALRTDFVFNFASRSQISKQKILAKLALFPIRWTLCGV